MALPPPLMRGLGGDPGPDIQTLEYDRLYVLPVRPQGATILLLRFGAPCGSFDAMAPASASLVARNQAVVR